MKTQTIVAALIFFVAGIFLNTGLISLSQAYKVEKEKYAQILNFKERFFDKDEWLNGDKANPKLRRAQAQLNKLAVIDEQINIRKWMTIAVYGVFLIGIVLLYGKTKIVSTTIFLLSVLALVCLHAGLFIPMLEIAAFERNLDLGLSLIHI